MSASEFGGADGILPLLESAIGPDTKVLRCLARLFISLRAEQCRLYV